MPCNATLTPKSDVSAAMTIRDGRLLVNGAYFRYARARLSHREGQHDIPLQDIRSANFIKRPALGLLLIAFTFLLLHSLTIAGYDENNAADPVRAMQDFLLNIIPDALHSAFPIVTLALFSAFFLFFFLFPREYLLIRTHDVSFCVSRRHYRVGELTAFCSFIHEARRDTG